MRSASYRPPRQLRLVSENAKLPTERRPTDAELIEAVVRGDAKVAGQLYDRLFGVVDHTLCRIFGRRERDHDDLVQAAFEQIIITLTSRRFAAACSLSSWASVVTSNVGLNSLRSIRRERQVLSWGDETERVQSVPTGSADLEQQASVRREIERVRLELANMDPVKATTVFLHDVVGHDLAEISVLMGVSLAAAQSRLVRGRKELFLKLGAAPSGDRLKGAKS